MAERESLQYEINLSSFRDDAIHKRMLLEKIELEFSSKLRNKAMYAKNFGWEVKFCRKNIEQIENIFAESHKSFIDLNLDFIYELFASAFKIMIGSYKALSEKLISLIKDKKKGEMQLEEVQGEKEFEVNLREKVMEQNKKSSDYLDGLILFIEGEEKKIFDKRKQAEEQILFEKECFENIQASDAVNQLGILRKELEKIILHTERIGEDGIMFRSMEFTDKLKLLIDPEDIESEFCTKLSKTTHKKFLNTMERISKKFYEKIRHEEKNEILHEIEQNKPEMKSQEIQTLPDPKNKEYGKDRNTLIAENEQLRKVGSGLRKELGDFGEMVEKMETENKELKKKIEITSEMLNKKASELQKLKIDSEYSTSKKDQLIESLNRKITEIKSEPITAWQSVTDPQSYELSNMNKIEDIDDEPRMENTVNEEFLGTRLRAVTREKSHFNSFFYEKEFKLSKKENGCLRKSLITMLDTLHHQKLILEYPVQDLNNDLKKGKLTDKIEEISEELLRNVKEIKDISSSLSPRKSKKHSIMSEIEPKNRKTSQFKFVSISTQTESRKSFEYPKQQHQKKSPKKAEQESTPKLTENKLETLKKELMKRVGMNKKTPTINNRSRQLLNEMEGISNVKNISADEWWRNDEEENKENKETKKSGFGKRDVSFEELRFQMKDSKGRQHEKRFLHQTNRAKINYNRNSVKASREPQDLLRDEFETPKNEAEIKMFYENKNTNEENPIIINNNIRLRTELKKFGKSDKDCELFEEFEIVKSMVSIGEEEI